MLWEQKDHLRTAAVWDIIVQGYRCFLLIAVGSKDKPVQFTSDLGRAGFWEGIRFGNNAAAKNVSLQHTVIEYAKQGVYFAADMGPVIKDSTIRHNRDYAF